LVFEIYLGFGIWRLRFVVASRCTIGDFYTRGIYLKGGFEHGPETGDGNLRTP
jgi:hypothetical protein